MEHRRLGNSDLDLPVITFGTWAVGGWEWGFNQDDNDSVRAIRRAIDVGINCIDTAAIYGMGHAEEIVGKAIEGRRDKVILITKCGIRYDTDKGYKAMDSKLADGTPCEIHRYLGAESIKMECEQSLKRLGIDCIDLYQCHQFDPTTPVEESIGALLDLQKEGKIRHIGVCNFSREQMELYAPHVKLVSDQPRYNLLDRDIEPAVVPYCVDHTIGILAYSPMGSGILSGKVTMDRTFPEGDHRNAWPWYKMENRKRVLEMLETFKPIAAGHDASLAQLAIAWVIAQKGVTSALIGARDERQVEENVHAAAIRLTGEELRVMREAAEALGKPQ